MSARESKEASERRAASSSFPAPFSLSSSDESVKKDAAVGRGFLSFDLELEVTSLYVGTRFEEASIQPRFRI